MIQAKKSLGQNFLINQGILDKIVDAATITSDDTVIEVGPGTGNLTEKILERGCRVLAIEKDHRLIMGLQELFRDQPKFQVLERDVLEFNPTEQGIAARNYKVVANIPYYITSHFIRQIFEQWPLPECIVLTVQKEVAQRIVAISPDMNLLALSVQYYADPEIISYVSRGSFRPIPNVDSAIIRLIPKSNQPTKEAAQHFFTIIKAAFSGKRKQLINTLSENLSLEKSHVQNILKKINISTTSRAEELPLTTWLELATHLLS